MDPAQIIARTCRVLCIKAIERGYMTEEQAATAMLDFVETLEQGIKKEIMVFIEGPEA